jgi:hypothetical protein
MPTIPLETTTKEPPITLELVLKERKKKLYMHILSKKIGEK